MICGFAAAGSASDFMSSTSLADAARAFDDAALRVSDSRPASLVRWTGPIYLAISDADGLRGLAAEIEASVRTQAAIARVPVTRVDFNDPRRNFVVAPADRGGRAACLAGINSQAGRIVSVDVAIYLNGRGSLTRCINHEVMHGFGFRSHAHEAMSILSYKMKKQTQISALDRTLIETMYDARLQPGMTPEAATATAWRILAEKLGVSAAETNAECGNRAAVHPQLAAFGRR
jgi:hypothetical protein